ncbi:hypothetical protein XENTR_v10008132 [Xenopus tropicalis]|nr:hypothetical protein XENTR_v10008132 [Xenopus tropicalis]
MSGSAGFEHHLWCSWRHALASVATGGIWALSVSSLVSYFLSALFPPPTSLTSCVSHLLIFTLYKPFPDHCPLLGH